MKNLNLLNAITLALFIIGISVAVFYNGTSTQETSANQITVIAAEKAHPIDPVN